MRTFFFITLLSLPVISCKESNPFNITESEGGFLVQENGKNILFYQKDDKSLNGEYTRSNYIHPLYNLDGGIITEDFPEDHRHHRGVFWAWHQVFIGDSSMGNGWELEHINWDVEDVLFSNKHPDRITLKLKIFWKSERWMDDKQNQKPFLEETTSVTIYRTTNNYRMLDFDIHLLALEDGVKIGGSDDEKGYSGFGVRTTIPDDLTFVSENKKVIPEILSIEAGPWMDFSGTFANTKCGVTILTHPEYPPVKQRWVIRTGDIFKSMQNARYPGRETVDIPSQDPVILKYRLVIHRGDADEVDLDKLYNNFINEK